MASFRKRGKKWEYRITYTINGEKHTESKGGFATKKEAEFHAIEHQNKINQGGYITSGNTPFFQYMSDWAKLYKREVVSPVTYKSIIRSCKMANTLFGNTPIKNITRLQYQSKIATLKNKSKSTVQKYHIYFKACFQNAVMDGVITRNPADNAVIVGNKERDKKENIKYISYEEAQKLIATLKQNIKPEYVSRYMILLSLYTGMRFAECLALTWDRIDFKEKTILIDRSWDYHITQDFIPTKNREIRKIVVNEHMLNFLLQLPKHSEFIFAKTDGTLPTNNGVNHALQKACKRANIKAITFHALRHTHGSILLYKGSSILYISKRLGHSSTAITQQVYLHLIDELKDTEEKLALKIFDDL
ncbi:MULTISPECIES: site-specific integrase [unclassified Granulicatella]|uniref:site-specific integrase n=1 Tax=unclassified Granulicatella TaxID=2630493 RepID=UPI001073470C|nr:MULTISPECIES: site-specific integrase [unclassified Granulicatella]MBF0780266.1 site-specific integrase [Granulicatella sp. 19428wC4_WM01]TFU95602.1 site-specific integrase [Granulicatella sp. WM01]